MNSGLSKEFFELVKSIGESRSKQDEDRIIVREVGELKEKMKAKNVKSKKMKELLIRMIYVEMLGHDFSDGHINGVKLASSHNMLEKRIGYLAVCLTIHKDHEYMYLLVNSLQKDLQSDNFLENCMALTTVCKLVNEETMPALKKLSMDLLSHKESIVRKKAAMVLYRFYQIDPSIMKEPGMQDKVRVILCDKDPSVMAASLHLFLVLGRDDPTTYKDLVPSFVSILDQITNHRLPKSFDYHRLPAPWIQLKLLQVLAALGAGDAKASSQMYSVLHATMKRANSGINVGYAIVYECVRTITTIYPDANLIEDAAGCVSRFIKSDNHNLKYLGVTALAQIVQINPKYAAEHQMTVIDCLEDPDETLKRKTLDLLYSMTNPQNVTVVVGKLNDFLGTSPDVYLRRELVHRINELAEKYAPDNVWYIDTMTMLFRRGGDLVNKDVAHTLMRLIAEGSAEEDDEEEDEEDLDIQQYAVETYLEMLESRARLPDVLLQVGCWVLGEFGHLEESVTRPELMVLLAECLSRRTDKTHTKAWVLSALLKQAAHLGPNEQLPQEVAHAVGRFQRSINVTLQQQAHEFFELLEGSPQLRQAVCPLGQSTEEVDVDADLSFLDSYVAVALQNGAAAYNPPEDAGDDFDGIPDHHAHREKHAGLNVTPYEQPETAPSVVPQFDGMGVGGTGFDGGHGGGGSGMGGGGGGGGSKGSSGPAAIDFTADSSSDEEEEELSRRLREANQRQGRSGFGGFGRSGFGGNTGGGGGGDVEEEHPSEVNMPPHQDITSLDQTGDEPPPDLHVTSSADPEPQPERAPELTEKEKKAQSLFMGIGGSSAGPMSRVAARKLRMQQKREARLRKKRGQDASSATTTNTTTNITTTTTTAPAPTTQDSAPQQGEEDLLGLGSGSQKTSGGGSSGGSNGGDTDLLDDIFASPAPKNNTAKKPSQSADDDDLFSALASSSKPQSTPKDGGLEDLLDGAVSTGGGSSESKNTTTDVFSQLQSSGAGSKQSGLVPAGMEKKLAGLGGRRSPPSPEMVLNGQRVNLYTQKVLNEHFTGLAVVVSNKTPNPLVTAVSFQIPAGFTCAGVEGFDSDAISQQQLPTRQNAKLPAGVEFKVAANASTGLLFTLSCSSGDALANAQLGSSGAPEWAWPVQVGVHGQQAPETTVLRWSLNDWMRPAPLNTNDFGNLFVKFPAQQRLVVKPSLASNSQTFMTLAQQLSLYPVQTIGQENIVAARLVAGSLQMAQSQVGMSLLALVHAQLGQDGGTTLLCHTNSQHLTAVMLAYLRQGFSKGGIQVPSQNLSSAPTTTTTTTTTTTNNNNTIPSNTSSAPAKPAKKSDDPFDDLFDM